jgi:hypothetical protein
MPTAEVSRSASCICPPRPAQRRKSCLDLREAAADPALLPVQEVVAAAQPVGATDAAAAPPPPITATDDTRSVDYSSTRWPLGWWLFCLSVRVWAWVAVGVWIGGG